MNTETPTELVKKGTSEYDLLMGSSLDSFKNYIKTILDNEEKQNAQCTSEVKAYYGHVNSLLQKENLSFTDKERILELMSMIVTARINQTTIETKETTMRLGIGAALFAIAGAVFLGNKALDNQGRSVLEKIFGKRK